MKDFINTSEFKSLMFLIVFYIIQSTGLTVQIFELSLYGHYKMISILSIEIGLNPEHSGSLFCVEWHEGRWSFDFLFLNGGIKPVKG